MKKSIYETEKRGKDTQKIKLSLEAECRTYEGTNQKEAAENYENTMILDKGAIFGEYNTGRFERDYKHITDFRATKQAELDKLVRAREKTHQEYMNMAELQSLINEANKYIAEIEEMHVSLQHLSIQIKELEDGTDFLQEQKDTLDDAKKATDEANEDLEKQLKAKEEANQKRLIAKLQRDKNPEIKDLIAKEESQQETNEDFSNKFREEREKLDQLLDEKIQLSETLNLTKSKFDTTKKQVGIQDEELKTLKETIDKKQADVNGKLKAVEAARGINLIQDEKNRTYSKMNAALRAKLEFIESKYDYSSSAKNMSIDDFKELMSSNQNVNTTMVTFNEKLVGIQKEIQSIEAMKNMFV